MLVHHPRTPRNKQRLSKDDGTNLQQHNEQNNDQRKNNQHNQKRKRNVARMSPQHATIRLIKHPAHRLDNR